MNHPYRIAEHCEPEPHLPTLDEVIRLGAYDRSTLWADKWTEPMPGFNAQSNGPHVCHTQLHRLVDGAKFDILFRTVDSFSLTDTFLHAAKYGLRMASLVELLWVGAVGREWVQRQRISRLYAAGSWAWDHWNEDSWMISIPYLSTFRCRAWQCRVDALPGIINPRDNGLMAFLIAY